MKSLLAGFCFVFISVAYAQRGPGGVVYANPSGFGNVAFPGTGRAPLPSYSFPQQLGATVAGRPLRTYNGNGGHSYGYAYPVYVGGGFGGYYGDSQPAQQQEPNVVIVNQAAPPQQAPTVIINQNFGPQPAPDAGANDTVHIFQPQSQQQPAANDAANGSRYYLLAFKDASVYTALAYWVEDKTLHYVTPQNTHNQVSLDLVDVDFTKKLNQDRNVPFTLAPAR